MDYQGMFNAAIAIGIFLGGWVLNSITGDLRRIASDFRLLDESHRRTREEYVSKVDHKDDIDGLGRRFDKIDVKLDQIMTYIHSNGG